MIVRRPRADRSSPGLRQPDFGRLWAGQAISWVGSEVTMLALPLLATLTLHATPTVMALLVASETLPMLAGPFVAGPLVDRFPRRRVMLLTDAARALLLGALPLLWLAGRLSAAVLVADAFLVGTLTTIFDAGFFAFVPQLVDAGRLARANGRLESTRSAAQLGGPALAGALVQAIGAPLAVAVDSVSFLASTLALATMRVAEAAPSPARAGYLASAREGIGVIWSRPALRLLALGSGLFNFFASAGMAVTVLYVIRTLHLAPAQYGAALSVGAAGGVLGGLAVPRIHARVGMRNSLAAGLVGASLGDLLVAAAPARPAVAIAMVAAGQFLATLFTTVYIVTNATLRQRLVPRELLGRTFTSMRVVGRGLMPFGALSIVAVTQVTSLRGALVYAGLGQLAVGLLFARRRAVLPRDESPRASHD